MTTKAGATLDSIARVLREALPSETIVDVSPSGIRKNIHVLVISRALDRFNEQQKQEYLWGLLEDAVKNGKLAEADLDRISLVLPLSVEELRR